MNTELSGRAIVKVMIKDFNLIENSTEAMSRLAALLKVCFTIPKIDFLGFSFFNLDIAFMTHNDDLRNVSC